MMMTMDTNQRTKKSRETAITLFEESVLKPDPKLRNCARNQECYDELMELRQEVLQFLETLRS